MATAPPLMRTTATGIDFALQAARTWSVNGSCRPGREVLCRSIASCSWSCPMPIKRRTCSAAVAAATWGPQGQGVSGGQNNGKDGR
jgi:hypothetical protein